MEFSDYQSQIQGGDSTDKSKTLSNLSSDFLQNIKNLRDPGYASSLLSKSKYTIKGSLAGGVIGFGVSMYFKQSLLFGVLIGILAGGAIGHILGEQLANKQQTT